MSRAKETALLEEELARLKTANRTLTVFVLLLAAVTVANVTLEWKQAEANASGVDARTVVRASEFVVEGENGEFLGSFGRVENGGIALVLDPERWGHGSFAVGSRGVSLDLSLNAAHVSMITAFGGAQVQILDGLHFPARPFVGANVDKSGVDGRRLRAMFGSELGLSGDGEPRLKIYGDEQAPRIIIGPD